MTETYVGRAAVRLYWLIPAGILFVLGVLWMANAVNIAEHLGEEAETKVWVAALAVAILWVVWQAYSIPVPRTL